MYHYNKNVSECLYICTDHLESVMKIVTKHGGVLFDAKYDAWGNQEIVKNDIGFIRGYTGHEEMPEFGLINMNARLYDPMLGRFISPDNFVQMPENSQNFNRYAYCLNNPLKYNDPSGNCIGAVIASVAFTMLSSACQTSMNHGDFGMFVKNFSLSMLSSVAGSYCSSVIGTAFGHTVGSFWNEALRAGAHGLFNGFMNAVKDDNFLSGLSGFAAGAVSSAAGSYAQYCNLGDGDVMFACTIAGSLASGVCEGGNGNAFLSGAMIGLEIGALNHCGESQDWYEDEDESLRWYPTTDEKLALDGKTWKNVGHTYTDKRGNYYSLYGQVYGKGDLNGKVARKIDEAFMKTARWRARHESDLPSLTDFSEFCKDTGFYEDHSRYFDYGGGKKNAIITYRTNPVDMLVSTTKFNSFGISQIDASAYSALFTPQHTNKIDPVRVWFDGKTGKKNYYFYQKLIDSYRR